MNNEDDSLVQVKIRYRDSTDEEFQCEKILAPNSDFGYWTFWYPTDDKDKVKVRMLVDQGIEEVEMYGENSTSKPKPPLSAQDLAF